MISLSNITNVLYTLLNQQCASVIFIREGGVSNDLLYPGNAMHAITKNSLCLRDSLEGI